MSSSHRMVDVQRALGELFSEADIRGRGWSKDRENPLGQPCLFIGRGNNLVVVSRAGESRLKIVQLEIKESTALGEETEQTLAPCFGIVNS